MAPMIFFQIFSVAFFSKNKIIPQTTFVPTFWPHIISELGGVSPKSGDFARELINVEERVCEEGGKIWKNINRDPSFIREMRQLTYIQVLPTTSLRICV